MKQADRIDGLEPTGHLPAAAEPLVLPAAAEDR